MSAPTLPALWSYAAPQRFLAAFIAVQVAAFLFFGALYALFPELREALIRENNLLENLTVLLFSKGVLAVAIILLIRERRGLPRRYWVVGALCILGFLEELSYFQLLLPFSFPTLPNGATFDSLSDLNRVMTIALDALGLPWPLVLGGVLLSSWL